uniref:Hexosyltransferase n=1 Tax=Clastoptera arizonana TaxID=38151 RepID=A0A1B6EH51_9HEMI
MPGSTMSQDKIQLCQASLAVTRRKYNNVLTRKYRPVYTLFGAILGFLIGYMFSSRTEIAYCYLSPSPDNPFSASLTGADIPDDYEEDPLSIIGLNESLTTENNQNNLLFVGVMTAEKYLSTRAVAVYETWGKTIPGKIGFFSSQKSKRPDNFPGLPLIPLEGVDDSYPPQKKSFMMLKYMWEQYGEHFEWFFRADDDVYIRTDRIVNILKSLDSRKVYFMGQAGKGNMAEFGLLSLQQDENFCMGGPGMLMSRETLARFAPHIKYCLKNLYTTHEDVEVGRCVHKFANTSCTWAYDMVEIFYHNYSSSGAYMGDLRSKEVHQAITLHPIKKYRYLYRLHNYIEGLRIRDLQQNNIVLHRELRRMAGLLNTTVTGMLKLSGPDETYLGNNTLFGQELSLNQYKPHKEEEVLKWDFVLKSLFSDDNLNPRRKPETAIINGLEDAVRELMEAINVNVLKRGREILFKEVLYGYTRLNPINGVNYVFDLLLAYRKFRGNKFEVPVRRHAYVQQTFSGMTIRETFDCIEVQPFGEENLLIYDEEEVQNGLIQEAIESGLLKIGETFPGLLPPTAYNRKYMRKDIRDKVVNFILPLAGRFKTFMRFINVFENVCLKNRERVTMTAVLFPSKTEDTYNDTIKVLSDLQDKYQYTRITVVTVDDPFARAVALELGAAQVSEPDDLLFFIDVDMIFTTATLNRIRSNTVRGKLVYFPIVYSEFDPTIVYNESVSPNHYIVNHDSGYWRQFGFGIASLYKSDLRKVGGFDTSIRGWGKEDVDLFDKFIAASENITIFRAVDPGLVHIFHIVECDPNLTETQLDMCKSTRASTFGDINQLSQLVYSDSQTFFSYIKEKKKSKS